MRPGGRPMMMGGLPLFTLQVSQSSISTTGPWDGSAKATGSVTVSQLTGAPVSFSGSWSLISGSGVSAVSSGSPTTTFSGNPPDENTSVSGVMRFTATNTLGQVATIDVSVTVSATMAVIAVNLSPSGVNTSHSNGSNFTQGFTASPTCPKSAGPFTIAWSAGAASMSPTSGSSSTMTMTPGGVGNQTLGTLRCDVSEPGGRTGVSNASCFVNWT